MRRVIALFAATFLAIAIPVSAELNPAITANSTCHIGIPVAVQFGGSCTGNIWDFGDGQTSDEPSPVNVYDGYGTFTISHVCTDGEANASDETYISIMSEGACPPDGVDSTSTEVEYDDEPLMIGGKGEKTNHNEVVQRDAAGNLIRPGAITAKEPVAVVEGAGIVASQENAIPEAVNSKSEIPDPNRPDLVVPLPWWTAVAGVCIVVITRGIL